MRQRFLFAQLALQFLPLKAARAKRERELPEVARSVAIIMDGNGRWADQRGLPVAAGHREGTRALRRAVEAAIDLGVEALTVYAFSTENWARPEDEVDALSFNDLKRLMQTTDGNLSVHARKLEDAEYIACTKSFEGRVPRTEYRLTPAGRQALERYLDHMEALIKATRER